jgi:hypothetical protein
VVLGVVVANSSGDHSKRMRTWLLRTPASGYTAPVDVKRPSAKVP